MKSIGLVLYVAVASCLVNGFLFAQPTGLEADPRLLRAASDQAPIKIDGPFDPVTDLMTEYTPSPVAGVFTPGQIFLQTGFEEGWTFGAPPGWTSTLGNTDSTWHRNDFNNGWSTAAGITRSPGSFTSNYVVSFMGGYSARFHTFDAPLGRRGFMVTPTIDLSTASDTVFISFLWTNTSGSDSLKVYVSTDGGTTFPFRVGFAGSTGGPWYQARGRVPSTSATTKIKLEVTSDAGYDDILLDEVVVYQKGSPYTGTLTLPGTFASFTDAARRLSIFGVSGLVTINVAAGTYADSVTFPPIPGASTTNTIMFASSGGAVTLQRDGVLTASTTTLGATSSRSDDFVIGLWGADYIKFDGIGVQGGLNTEWGYWVRSSTPDDGANNNTIQNALISMNTTTSQSMGIRQHPFWALTAQSGASSNNHYYNNSIQSCSFRGLLLQGSPPYLDVNNEVASVSGGTATFFNIFTTTTFAPAAIAVGGQNGVSIHHVTIDSVASSPFFGSVIGILVGTSTGATDSVVNFSIYNNNIRRIVHSGVGSANVLSAIRVAATSNAMRGMVYNNFVSSLRASDTTLNTVCALYQGGGINTNVGWYYNTVLLDNASIGPNGGNVVVRIDAGAPTFRNNVFVNRSPQTGTGKNYVYNVIGGSLTASNNALYVDTALTNRFIGFLGVDRRTLPIWQTGAPGLDGQSVYESPNFVNSATLPYNLHINPATGTGLESGAINIAGITTDFDDQTRVVGPAGPNLAITANSAPDIGADEFSGIPLDILPPLISYVPLSNANLTTNRTLAVTITDAVSRVDRRAGLKPRLYFKKNGGADWGTRSVDSTGVVVGNTWTFTINNTQLGGVATGDTVYYYVAATDSSGNAATNPSGGSGLPPGNVPPSTSNLYRIQPSVSGTVTIGTGGTFATVKSFFDSVNVSLVTANLVANIISDVTEAATATLNALSYASGGPFAVNLRPSGDTRTVSGSIAGALLDFNGADFVTIDGIGKTLTLSNTNTAGQTIQFRNDAMFDTVRSCILRGANTSTTSGTIVFGTSTLPIGGVTGNRSIIIQNNDIQGAATLPANSVYSSGTAAPASNGSNSITGNNIFDWSAFGINLTLTGNSGNWVISNNSFYDTLVVTPTRTRTAINFVAGTLSGGNTISGNFIGGQAPNAGGNPWTTTDTVFTGIALSVDLIVPTTVSGNTIQNISLTSVADGVIFRGISATVGSANITNNTIGHPTNSNSIVNAGNGPRGIGSRPTTAIISSAAGGTSATVVNVISGNSISNISTTGTTIGNRISAIENGGSSSIATINNNTIYNLSSASLHNNILGGQVTVMGIFVSGGTIGVPAQSTIKGNVIHTLVATNTADSATNVSGISISNNHVGIIENNLIYDLRNGSNRNISTTPSTAVGIYVRAIGGGGGVTDGTDQLVNNMIALGSSQTTNTEFVGIWQGFNTAGKTIMLHNSVSITGTVTSGSIASSCFLRGLNTGVSLNSPIVARDNIFSNTRSGGTGKHYAIANQSTAANALGWSGAASDNNVLFTQNAATLGLWGTGDSTFAGWKAVSGGDSSSQNADPRFVSSTDLHIDPAGTIPSPAANRGIPVGGFSGAITTDFDGQARNLSTPDIGADEFTLRRPTSFTLTSPANNAVGQPLTGTLAWQASAGASTYDVFFDTNNPPTTLVSSNQSVTTYNYSVAQQGGNYFWNIVAKNVDSTRSSTNGPFHFTTVTSTFSVAPSTINFGNVTVGSPRTDSVTVTNTGTATLVIDSVKSTNTQFAVTPTTASIFPSDNAKFYITFSPTSATAVTGNVVYFHNAPSARDTVRMNATGVFPAQGWTAQNSGVTVSMKTVKAVSAAISWIGGGSGTVLRTTDGGATWTSVGRSPISATANIISITALDQNTAFVTNSPDSTNIYRTTNGGTSWQRVYVDGSTGAFIDAVHMYDANNGIALGDPVGGKWVVLKTSNGGASWARVATEPTQVGAEAGWINSFHVVGTTHIWFGTNASRVYRSTDAGATWSSSPTTALNSYALWFNSTQFGVAGFSDGSAARTTDGGATWNAVTISGTGTILGVGGAGLLDFWIPKGNIIYRSSNRGATWSAEYTSTIGTTLQHLNLLTAGSSTFGWVGSLTGGIARLFATLTGVDESQEEIPSEFALLQNYPNPFNPSTTIQYGLVQASDVVLTIYNVLGQEVTRLVDDVQGAGYHRAVWDGRNKSGVQVGSGTYFYRIEAKPSGGGGVYVATKKLLLLK